VTSPGCPWFFPAGHPRPEPSRLQSSLQDFPREAAVEPFIPAAPRIGADGARRAACFSITFPSRWAPPSIPETVTCLPATSRTENLLGTSTRAFAMSRQLFHCWSLLLEFMVARNQSGGGPSHICGLPPSYRPQRHKPPVAVDRPARPNGVRKARRFVCPPYSTTGWATAAGFSHQTLHGIGHQGPVLVPVLHPVVLQTAPGADW